MVKPKIPNLNHISWLCSLKKDTLYISQFHHINLMLKLMVALSILNLSYVARLELEWLAKTKT